MLHIVNKSPFEKSVLDACLDRAVAQSPILLIEDAVVAATKGTAVESKISGAMKDHAFYVLGHDLEARGLATDQVIDGITVVDYGGFVDLVVEKGPTQSWL